MSEWAEKCKDPRWQKLRLKIMERDNWRCTICNSQRSNLHVHHVVYSKHRKNPWDYPDNVLQTLCHVCHSERHELIDSAADALKICLKRVPTDRIKKITQWFFDQAMKELNL